MVVRGFAAGAGLGNGVAGALNAARVAERDPGEGEGKTGAQRFEGKGLEAARFESAVSGLGPGEGPRISFAV